jgi:hypothetical protein
MPNHMSQGSVPVREVNRDLFVQLAGGDAAFALVSKLSGGDEIIVPEGAEYELENFPDEVVTALYSVTASSCYEKCKEHKKYRCCSGVCVRIGDC